MSIGPLELNGAMHLKAILFVRTLDARLLVPLTPLRAAAPTAGGLCFQHLPLPAGGPGLPACPLRIGASS